VQVRRSVLQPARKSGNLTKATSDTPDSLMELSPSWEAANCAATQKLPSILLNPKVHHRVHKSPPMVPILNQINPIYTILSYLSKIHFNIVHPPTSSSSQWSTSFRLSHQYPICDIWHRGWNVWRFSLLDLCIRGSRLKFIYRMSLISVTMLYQLKTHFSNSMGFQCGLAIQVGVSTKMSSPSAWRTLWFRQVD
jgi:hypothetical protein